MIIGRPTKWINDVFDKTVKKSEHPQRVWTIVCEIVADPPERRVNPQTFRNSGVRSAG